MGGWGGIVVDISLTSKYLKDIFLTDILKIISFKSGYVKDISFKDFSLRQIETFDILNFDIL